ncbi:hypothetical protein HDU86_002317 [Geranomyces michiganensis]|nr:hypothetical protein HDU86_002317 [Geranomyces michiganensis]
MFRLNTPSRARSGAPASFQSAGADRHQPAVGSIEGPAAKVAVFWEFQEGCLTGHSPAAVVSNIRNAVRPLGQLVQFRAYVAGYATLPMGAEETMKAQTDAMIVSDIFTFALDNPAPAAIVLISSEGGDFSYALSLLNGRGYTIGLVCTEESPSSVLQSSATMVIPWADIVPPADYPVSDRIAEHRYVAPPAPNIATYVRRVPSSPPAPSTSKFVANGYKPRPMIPVKAAPTPPRPSSPAKFESYPSETTGTGVAGLHFGQLVNILTVLKEAGNVEPLWSQVGSKIDKEFLRRRGITFKEYINAAVERGLVVCGAGRGAGSEWMALPPRHGQIKPPPDAEEPPASNMEETDATVPDETEETDATAPDETEESSDSDNESIMEFAEFAGPVKEEIVAASDAVAPAYPVVLE